MGKDKEQKKKKRKVKWRREDTEKVPQLFTSLAGGGCPSRGSSSADKTSHMTLPGSKEGWACHLHVRQGNATLYAYCWVTQSYAHLHLQHPPYTGHTHMTLPRVHTHACACPSTWVGIILTLFPSCLTSTFLLVSALTSSGLLELVWGGVVWGRATTTSQASAWRQRERAGDLDSSFPPNSTCRSSLCCGNPKAEIIWWFDSKEIQWY